MKIQENYSNSKSVALQTPEQYISRFEIGLKENSILLLTNFQCFVNCVVKMKSHCLIVLQHSVIQNNNVFFCTYLPHFVYLILDFP